MKNLYYGWILVIMAACILGMQALMFYGRGVFLIPVTTEFGWDRGTLSGAFSIFLLVSGPLAILTGRLNDKYGPRVLLTVTGLLLGAGCLLMSQVSSLWQVYLIWALFMGVGTSCCIIPIMSTIPRWFTRRRGTAIGITSAGFGLGGVIWPLVAQELISAYSWRHAFFILGLIVFAIIIPLAQFMKHSPQRIGLKPYGESETVEYAQSPTSATGGLSFTQAVKTSRFWLFGLIIFCLFFCLHVIMVHIAPHAVDLGISPMLAASIISILAGTSVIGRLSTGFISDRAGARLILSVCLSLLTLALVWLLFVGEIWTFYLFAVITGFAIGGYMPLEILIVAELFGLKSLGMIYGTIMIFSALGMTLGPIIAGTIFDMTGNYNWAFLICIILGALAIFLSLLLLRYKGKKDLAISG